MKFLIQSAKAYKYNISLGSKTIDVSQAKQSKFAFQTFYDKRCYILKNESVP